jgi:hypothetical protein
MTPKEALASIKNLLKAKFSEEAASEFEASKLSDGTAIEISKLESGGDFLIVAADGNKTPAPAGEYELEDARIVVVTEPGKIAEVKDKATETPAEEKKPEEQKMAEEAPAAEGSGAAGLDWSSRIQDLERQLTWVVEAYATLKNAMTAFKADTNVVLTSVVGLVEQIASEETGDVVTQPKQTVFSSDEKRKKKEEAKQKTAAAFAAFSDKLKEKQK